MIKLFRSSPNLSFILLNFLITFTFWFMPLLVKVPDDMFYALILLGGCGPFIAGYIITVVNSGERVRIHSKIIFISVFVFASFITLLEIFVTNNRMPNKPERIPTIDEFSYLSLAIL